MGKERKNSFDVLKGILIFLVVFGHAIQYVYADDCWHNSVFNFIYTFHMPLFVFLSGYFFSSCLSRPFMETVVRKFKRLLLPWLVWMIPLALVYFTSQHFREVSTMKIPLILDDFNTGVVQQYWYLICVFVLTVIYYIMLSKWTESFFLRYSITVAIVLFLAFILVHPLPWYVFPTHCQIPRQFLVFGLGIACCMKDTEFKRMLPFLFVISSVVLIYNKLNWGVYIGGYNEAQRVIDGLCATIIAYSILMPFCNFAFRTSVGRLLAYLGKNSLGFYVIHMVFYRIATWNSSLIKLNFGMIEAIVLSVIWLIASLFVIKLIKHFAKDSSYIFGV